MKEQTWLEAADSAKGTLMPGVEADETVEEVAPCIMGTFIQASRTQDKEDKDVGVKEERGEQEWYGYHDEMCKVKNKIKIKKVMA